MWLTTVPGRREAAVPYETNMLEIGNHNAATQGNGRTARMRAVPVPGIGGGRRLPKRRQGQAPPCGGV